jgi:hypothetical protein
MMVQRLVVLMAVRMAVEMVWMMVEQLVAVKDTPSVARMVEMLVS